MRLPEEAVLAPQIFASVGFGQFEKVVEIVGGLAANFFHRKSAEFAQLPGNFLYERRFVALATIRNRRQKGRISFNQCAFWGYISGCIADGLCLGKGDVAREGNQESKIQCSFRIGPSPSKAVQNSPQARRFPMLFQ